MDRDPKLGEVTVFRFTIPGQPPSWNASYRMRRAIVRGKYGQPVLGDDLQPKKVSRLFKTQEVVDYQEGIQYLVKAARPKGFDPKHQVLIGFQMYLSRMLDSDNVMKAIHDAIAKGLGMNDNRFLPVTLHKQTGSKDPRVVIFVCDADHWFNTISASKTDSDLLKTE